MVLVSFLDFITERRIADDAGELAGIARVEAGAHEHVVQATPISLDVSVPIMMQEEVYLANTR
jgi:hypothetical protein